MVSQHQSQTRKQTKEYSSSLACLSLLKSATLLRLGGRVGSPSFLARLTGQKKGPTACQDTGIKEPHCTPQDWLLFPTIGGSVTVCGLGPSWTWDETQCCLDWLLALGTLYLSH